MTKLALGVEYLGQAYCGWQKQHHCSSVQAQIEKALGFIANQPVEVFCAGRTDTGVNAVGQVVHFESSVERPINAWLEGTNTRLPDDVRISWVTTVDKHFHARFSAVARQYRYVIFNRPTPCAILTGRVTWERHPLDVNKMHQAAQLLLGEQDFSSFRASECQASHPRREVQMVRVTRRGDFVFIDIKANAFLHHMVRNIAGTLVQIGRGQADPSWVETLLALKDRTQATVTAAASGLYFVNAFYPSEFGLPITQPNEVLWQ
ncbi:tRNA pseudouridine(38-40) synthase TruA [Thiomicrospira sp. R3]|uniref:tRNA pseudouridine(38-40) synthase TruA n=1 Tax=Thiomicrospira sp. R3 TaxID=3035472 RepID=UPI00259BF108|nr:tRNA pseudouridine(38-40) synthase TruA [Thiomicrospira sp. R3]WFE68057.1 tRNA pseudouridine(38-40) synthase TruA [Thiomicrospira sp. R3]